MDFAQYRKAFDEVARNFEVSVEQFGLPFESVESCPRSRRDKTVREIQAMSAGAAEASDTSLDATERDGFAPGPFAASLEMSDIQESHSYIHCENGGASIWRGWISPACLACRKGEQTATFFVSLKCTKNCYFCFNPNQENYEYFRHHTRDITAELRQAYKQGQHFNCLAVTGGEPCLHKPEVLDFLRCAKELYPDVHVRIYTSGDLLDDAFLAELASAGLDELRFSVKPQETDGVQAQLFDRIGAAVKAIPDVMVEMPVIPGEEEEMRRLLLRLDAMGVRGINLLEFCFPLYNEDEFQRRDFMLRRKPYKVLYNYWYAGGLPVAGSEAACLDLLRFAEERKLGMGVHYCSLDNKNTGQVFQQNRGFLFDDAFARSHAWLSMDTQDYFLKCARAFEEDAVQVCTWLEGMEGSRAVAELQAEQKISADVYPNFGHSAYEQVSRLSRDIAHSMNDRAAFLHDVPVEQRIHYDEETASLVFPLSWARLVHEQFPRTELAQCWYVVEFDESAGPILHEVSVNLFV